MFKFITILILIYLINLLINSFLTFQSEYKKQIEYNNYIEYVKNS